MPLEGVIRLGFNLGVAPSMLFPLMSELRRSHPRLEVRCQTAPSEQLLARLQAGSLDIVLGAQRAGDLRGEIIRKERLVWVGDIDNLVKPILIARGAGLSLLVIGLGVFGGVLVFGFIGIFLGPVLLALGQMLLLRWLNKKDVA